MDSPEVTDHELLDAASRLLMASLRQSRDLNIEIRDSLQRQGHAVAAAPPESAKPSNTSTVFDVLRDIIDGSSRR